MPPMAVNPLPLYSHLFMLARRSRGLSNLGVGFGVKTWKDGEIRVDLSPHFEQSNPLNPGYFCGD